ncbi:MAG: hypothetical protein LBL35_03115 [Clostridiales bacterium]|jgi:hypothetical protein|nr:hypothetical protein [Clostridiales bacterium]
MTMTKCAYDDCVITGQDCTLEITSNNVVDFDECVSYRSYGLKIISDKDGHCLNFKNISIKKSELEHRISTIINNDVPYYQIKDVLDDYLIS